MVTIKRLLNKSFKKRTLSDVSPHIRYGHLKRNWVEGTTTSSP